MIIVMLGLLFEIWDMTDSFRRYSDSLATVKRIKTLKFRKTVAGSGRVTSHGHVHRIIRLTWRQQPSLLSAPYVSFPFALTH